MYLLNVLFSTMYGLRVVGRYVLTNSYFQERTIDCMVYVVYAFFVYAMYLHFKQHFCGKREQSHQILTGFALLFVTKTQKTTGNYGQPKPPIISSQKIDPYILARTMKRSS